MADYGSIFSFNRGEDIIEFRNDETKLPWKYEYCAKYGSRVFYRIYNRIFQTDLVSDITKYIEDEYVTFRFGSSRNITDASHWHFSTLMNYEEHIIKSCMYAAECYERSIPPFRDVIQRMDYDIKRELHEHRFNKMAWENDIKL